MRPIVGVVEADSWECDATAQWFNRDELWKISHSAVKRNFETYANRFWSSATSEEDCRDLAEKPEVWVRCDDCGAWRIAVSPLANDMSDVHLLPRWVCEMNVGGTTSCGVDDISKRRSDVLPQRRGRGRVPRVSSKPGANRSMVLGKHDRGRIDSDAQHVGESQQKYVKRVPANGDTGVEDDPNIANADEPPLICDDAHDDGSGMGLDESQFPLGNGARCGSYESAGIVQAEHGPELDLDARTPEPHELPITGDLEESNAFVLVHGLTALEESEQVTPGDSEQENPGDAVPPLASTVPAATDAAAVGSNAAAVGASALLAAQAALDGGVADLPTVEPSRPVPAAEQTSTGASAGNENCRAGSVLENDDCRTGVAQKEAAVALVAMNRASTDREGAPGEGTKLSGVPTGTGSPRNDGNEGSASAPVAKEVGQDTDRGENCRGENYAPESCGVDGKDVPQDGIGEGSSLVLEMAGSGSRSEELDGSSAAQNTSGNEQKQHDVPEIVRTLEVPEILRVSEGLASPDAVGVAKETCASGVVSGEDLKGGKDPVRNLLGVVPEPSQPSPSLDSPVPDAAHHGIVHANGDGDERFGESQSREHKSEGSKGPSHGKRGSPNEEDANRGSGNAGAVRVGNEGGSGGSTGRSCDPGEAEDDRGECVGIRDHDGPDASPDAWRAMFIKLVTALDGDSAAGSHSLSSLKLAGADELLNEANRRFQSIAREAVQARADRNVACDRLDNVRRLIRLFLERGVGVIRPNDDEDEPIESHFGAYLQMIDVLPGNADLA